MIWLAALVGACWRRFWGMTRPSWAFPGYRAAQAGLGAGALFGLCLYGHPWWEAGLRTGLAMALMTERAQCLPIIWSAWERLSDRIPWLKTKWTMFAEATAGAVIWGVLV